ncbi:MAG: 4Fe-4S binding protein [Actinomycetota bacterium]|nr:4Fe-4S binding protein [Actinomycetota bacterium]
MAIMSPSDKLAQVSGQNLSGGSSSLSAFLYVTGFIGLIGSIVGRIPCGWLCPFGFLQDILYKIPLRKIRFPSKVRYLKYFSLFIVAMLIPFLTGVHWFSRLCPAGTLEGLLPLRAIPPFPSLPPGGWFVWLKIFILAFIMLWSIFTSRPFCRAICPLGAALSLFNPISLYRMEVKSERCTNCGKCKNVCPVGVDVTLEPNSHECIRCLTCKKECPTGAIDSGFLLLKTRKKQEQKAK